MSKTAVLIAGLFAAGPADAAEPIRLGPGAVMSVQLVENPSTGYSWRLNADASAGLEHVAIVDEGHTRGGSLPGAPGTHRWTIHALSTGAATLRFAYQRPWEPTPIETRAVTIKICPAQKGM